MSEIFARGPVAATINANPILEYKGGVFSDDSFSTSPDHIVSIVGWGMDEETGKQHWIVRNSWGQYWGEMGYIRVEVGKNLLGLEGEVAWATPKSWTETNIPCNEDGANCSDGSGTTHGSVFYEDPSLDTEAVQRRLVEHSKSNVQRRLR